LCSCFVLSPYTSKEPFFDPINDKADNKSSQPHHEHTQHNHVRTQEALRIWEIEKRTVLFVTNNIDEALYLGDRIVIMEGKLPGQIQTIHEISLPRPREHDSKSFLELRKKINESIQLTL